MTLDKKYLELMFTIRFVENALLDFYQEGVLRGTTHTSIGQEAISVAVSEFIDSEDTVISNHRCHGHYLSYGGDYIKLFEEIKGSALGVSGGVGGSQHLSYKNFISNGIHGGMVPISVGVALSKERLGKESIVVIFLGDGTMGQGVLYESLNLASLMNAPVLFVVENNSYAQSTHISDSLSGSIKDRFKSFSINVDEVTTNDVCSLLDVFKRSFSYVRNNRKPFCQIVNTYRLSPHSKGDDFRNTDEINKWKKRDPLSLIKRYYSKQEYSRIEQEVGDRVKLDAVNVFKNNPIETFDTIIPTDDDIVVNLKDKQNSVLVGNNSNDLFVVHINRVLDKFLSASGNNIIIGEDICDPYGGAFKVTQGLSTKYPNQVINTPISEQAIVGVANGFAISGIRPVVEIMFGDFTTLIFDQIVNHATKFSRMYSSKIICPIIIRTPMGGYRGYGPTHSQSLEKFFIGVPGLLVIAASFIVDQEYIWSSILIQNNPVLYIENKSLYSKRMKVVENKKIEGFCVRHTNSSFPTVELQLTGFRNKPDVVILTYGDMADNAMSVSKKLYIDE